MLRLRTAACSAAATMMSRTESAAVLDVLGTMTLDGDGGMDDEAWDDALSSSSSICIDARRDSACSARRVAASAVALCVVASISSSAHRVCAALTSSSVAAADDSSSVSFSCRSRKWRSAPVTAVSRSRARAKSSLASRSIPRSSALRARRVSTDASSASSSTSRLGTPLALGGGDSSMGST